MTPPRDVRAVLNGPDEVGGAEGVVDHQGQAAAVGDGGNGVNVRDVAVGVAQGLDKDGLGVLPDGPLQLRQVVGVHKGGLHAVGGEGVGQQVVAAAVDGLLRHDVVPALGQGLDGVGDRRRAGGHGQGPRAALQGRQALLQRLLGGVGEPAVDVALLRQVEPGGGVGGAVKHVGRGLVDGHRPCAGGGVRPLLSHVELKGLEFVVAHGFLPLFPDCAPGGRGTAVVWVQNSTPARVCQPGTGRRRGFIIANKNQHCAEIGHDHEYAEQTYRKEDWGAYHNLCIDNGQTSCYNNFRVPKTAGRGTPL